MAAIHSASVSRTSRAKSCRCRTSAVMICASRGSFAVAQRSTARSVMLSSVTSCIVLPLSLRTQHGRRPPAMARIFPSAAARGRYFIPQSGAITSCSRREVRVRPAHAIGHRLGRLDLGRRQVHHTEDDRLVGQVGQHAEVEAGLGGLDRDLVDRAARQLGQERVARRALVDDRGVAEAQVHRRGAGDAVQRRGEGGQAVGAGGVGAGLQVRLVDLDDVGPRGVQVLDLGVDGRRVRHRGRLEVRVVVVLRLLGHRERPGHRHLDRTVGVRLEELQVTDLDRTAPGDRPDDPRHRVGVPASGRARCRGCRRRRRRARWRSGWSSSRGGSHRR